MSSTVARLRIAALIVVSMALGATQGFADPPHDRPFSVKWSDASLNRSLSDVRFADRRTGWAVGEDGTVLATTDGETWESRTSGTDRALMRLGVADARTAWAVGAGGTVLATRDGGANWLAQPSGTQRTLRDIHLADARTGWAVGDGGVILATTDGGATWQPQTSGTTRGLIAVHFANARAGWVAGAGGIILATQDGGATWRLQQSTNRKTLRRLHFIDAQTGWAVGAGGAILATSDAGATWRTITGATEKNLYDVRFIDPRRGWAVGEEGTILTTDDAGANWMAQRGTTDKSLFGVHIADAQTGWAVGAGGTILSNQNQQDTSYWRSQSGNDIDLYHVYFADGRNGWLVGDGGLIRATRDAGATWKAQKSGTDKNLRGVHFVTPQTGWVAGSDGAILATRDGATWETQQSGTDKNLGGIHFADAQSGWAIGTDGLILATRDGGKSWQQQASGTEAGFQNVRFVDAKTGWAVGDSGTIVATRDGGATWRPQKSGTEKSLLHLHFVSSTLGWVVGEEGIIRVTRDGGATWAEQNSGVDSDLYHVHFASASTGWIVGKQGVLLATRDGGNTWSRQKSATEKTLASVHFGAPETGFVVGFGGAMMRAGPPAFAPWADDLKVSVSPGIQSSLDVSFAVHSLSGPEAREARLEARGVAERAAWNTLGSIMKAETRDKRWHLTWKPADFNIHSGDNIEYRVLLADGETSPAAAIRLGAQQFDPYLSKLWRENSNYILAGLSAFGGLFAYMGVLGLILLVKPAWPARWGSAPVLDDLPKPSGNLAFGWELGRKAIGIFVFTWMCRLPRVRCAWIKQYAEGKSGFDDLGKARAHFLSSPEVLDAWVARVASRVEAALAQFDLFHQRRIYVELPVRVGDQGKLIERPNAETLRHLFSRERTVVGIIGGGGSGKSTLGCALARWAICADPSERLAPHRMIPVVIVQDTTNLVEAITQNLRRMLGDESLPDDLVRGLLARQRILVVIDALSERLPETQAHIEQVFGQAVPLNAIIITSRSEPRLDNVDRTMLYPVRLDAARVVPFIIGYLDRMADVGLFRDGRLQLRLGDQILALAESGGRKTPITPLLVTLFVRSAVQRALDGLSFDGMPQAVPEVFVDYLRRLNSQSDGKITEDVFIQATQTLASISVGQNLVPQDFSMDEAVAALTVAIPDAQPRVLVDRLVASGVIERRTPGGYVALRFSVDPAAEYLAAIRQLFKMKRASREDFNAYVASLTKTEGYPRDFEGYLLAFATCYRAYKRDFSLPEIAFPWEQSAEQSAPAAPPIAAE